MATPKELRAIRVGTALADGSIYAGISPTTGFPLFVAAEDKVVRASDVLPAAAMSSAHGYHGWRVPTYEELSHIRAVHNVGALKGTFNEGAEWHACYYASSDHIDTPAPNTKLMRVRMMGEGDGFLPLERTSPLIWPVSLRLVRA